MNQIWMQPEPARGATSPRTLSFSVRGGASAFFEVEAGDRLRIVDPEGCQPAFLYARPDAFGAAAADGRVASNVGDLLRRRGEGMGGEAESARPRAAWPRSVRSRSARSVSRRVQTGLGLRGDGGCRLGLRGHRPRRPDGAGRAGSADRSAGGDRACHVPRGEGAAAPRSAPSRPAREGRDGGGLHGQGRSVHPDHRRGRAPMCGFPRLRCRRPRSG